MTTLTRAFITMVAIILCLATAAALLLSTFPWSTHHGSFAFPWQVTAASYVIGAALTVLGGAVIPWIVTRRRGTRSAAAIYGTSSLVGMLLLIVVFSGPGLSLNIPGTRVRGIFFSEWNFVSFAMWVALPFTAFTTLVVWLATRSGRQV